jgi:hypothetical protein
MNRLDQPVTTTGREHSAGAGKTIALWGWTPKARCMVESGRDQEALDESLALTLGVVETVRTAYGPQLVAPKLNQDIRQAPVAERLRERLDDATLALATRPKPRASHTTEVEQSLAREHI